MLSAKIIGWRNMLNLERKIFRSSISTACLRYFYVIILRDRELIGGISRLVQFFHVKSDNGRKEPFYAVKMSHTKIHHMENVYTIFSDILLSISQK